MKEWSIEHPYLTFFLILSFIAMLNSTFASGVKKEKQKENND